MPLIPRNSKLNLVKGNRVAPEHSSCEVAVMIRTASVEQALQVKGAACHYSEKRPQEAKTRL